MDIGLVHNYWKKILASDSCHRKWLYLELLRSDCPSHVVPLISITNVLLAQGKELLRFNDSDIS